MANGIGPRGAVYPSGTNGEAHNWTREIYGVRYGFVFVRRPDGELRWFVQKWIPRAQGRTFGRWAQVQEGLVRPDGRSTVVHF
jgi:hypothetical protein